MTNMPFASPNATYRSDWVKSNLATSGWTISHFNTFSGLIVLYCALTSAPPFSSAPENCRELSAAPTRNAAAKTSLSAGVAFGCAAASGDWPASSHPSAQSAPAQRLFDGGNICHDSKRKLQVEAAIASTTFGQLSRDAH